MKRLYLGQTKLSDHMHGEKEEEKSGLLLLLYLAFMVGGALGYAYRCAQLAGV